MSVLDGVHVFSCPLSPSISRDDYKVYFSEGADPALFGSKQSVCAIGAFDGVHLGHKALVRAAINEAAQTDALALVVTFDPDPAFVLGSASSDALLCVPDRIRALLALGADAVVTIAFTSEFSALTYQEFLRDYLVNAFCAKSIHVGENFRMGSGGRGTAERIAGEAEQYGISVHAHPLECVLNSTVSATRIRSLLRAGKTNVAALLLERPHMVRGFVEHGRGEGTSFGFPTANIRVSSETCLPAEGVYAGWVSAGERAWPAAINVGAPRTFGGKVGDTLLEATLLGFDGNLYDQELCVYFDQWLRAPKQFPTLLALETTVLSNIDWVRQNIGEGEVHD